MNAALITDCSNWCFAGRAKALQEYGASHGVKCDIVPYSAFDNKRLNSVCWPRYQLVFVLANAVYDMVKARAECPILTCHNNGPGRRPQLLIEHALSADGVLINNFLCWVGAHQKMPRLPLYNISNGVDRRVFTPGPPIADRPHRVVFTCSSQKADDQEDVKGLRDVLAPLKILLENAKGWEVDYRIVHAGGKAYTPHEMAQWYQQASYVVCASKSEGTPNYLLEAMSCGCVPVSVPVGNVPELVDHGLSGIVLTDRTTAAMWDGLKQAKAERERLSAGALDAIASWDWSQRAPLFFELFAEIAAGRRPEPYSYVDRIRRR